MSKNIPVKDKHLVEREGGELFITVRSAGYDATYRYRIIPNDFAVLSGHLHVAATKLVMETQDRVERIAEVHPPITLNPKDESDFSAIAAVLSIDKRGTLQTADLAGFRAWQSKQPLTLVSGGEAAHSGRTSEMGERAVAAGVGRPLAAEA